MASEREWQRRVRAWRSSGKTAREFGASAGVNWHTLRWWAWRLRSRGDQPRVRLVRLVTERPPGSCGVAVEVRDGLRLRVEPGFDADLLRAVVHALEAAE